MRCRFAVLLLLAAGGVALAAPEETEPAGDAAMDRHALLAPPEVEARLDRLAEYLIEPARCDRDRARAIFRWTTDRIRYDVDALMTGHPGEIRPEVILAGRKACAWGYAALVEALARKAGLEAVTLPGFAKGAALPDEDRPIRPNHAWNAVKIDGRWQLMDACLGAGLVRGQRFRKHFQEQFFLPPPQQLLLTHYPIDARWQLVPFPLSPWQWDRQPQVDVQQFGLGLRWNAQAGQLQTPGARGPVRLYAHHHVAKVLAAPQGSQLVPGQEYYFLIDAPEVNLIAFVQKDQWTVLRKNGTRFEGTIRPEPGRLKVNVQRNPQDRSTQTLIAYEVRS